MQRKRLVATVAAAPILALAHGAYAQVEITTETTAPVQTSTAGTGGTPSAVTITSTGSIKAASSVSGPILLMDSNHNITNQGLISSADSTGAVTGMAAQAGTSGVVTNSGTISLTEDYTPTDADNDGDADGPFAEGADRIGIDIQGPFTGAVTNSGNITVEGQDSAGIRVTGDLLGGVDATHTGTLTHTGGIGVAGENARGIDLTGGTIEGDVEVRGGVNVVGPDAIAVNVESDVDGTVRIQGAVSATGYRYANPPTSQQALDNLDAEDLLQHGGAVKITGNVGGGVIVDVRPTTDADPDEDDEDGDGFEDAREGNGSITSLGAAPALLIADESGAGITIGQVAASGDDAHALVVKGAVTGSGVYEGVSGTGIQIGGVTGGGATTLNGGIRLDGDVRGMAVGATATGVRIGEGAVVGTFRNDGSILGQAVNVSAPHILEVGQTAVAVDIDEAGAVSSFTNTGTVRAVLGGEKGQAIGIRGADITTLTNTGRIEAYAVPTDDAKDLDDDDTQAGNETTTAEAIAIDLSSSTLGVTITQNGQAPVADAQGDSDGDGIPDAEEPAIIGDVRLGSGNDAIILNNGSLEGDIDFGAGSNTLTVDGGARMIGWLEGTDTNADIDINLTDGLIYFNRTGVINASDLTVGAEGMLYVKVDAAAGETTRLVVDTATFETGAKIGVDVSGLIDFSTAGAGDYVIVDAGVLTGTVDDSLLGASPFIYKVGVTADEATDEVRLSLRRRTAEEANLTAAEAAAFGAFYDAIMADSEVQTAILQQQTEAGFKDVYDQLLPDQGEGLFSALEMAQLSIARAVATRPDLRGSYGPDSFWIQELNMQVKRDGGETLGSEAKGFGFVAGYESMSAKGGALGATLAYISAEEEDDAAKVGEQTTVNLLEGGLYWRQAAGSWLFSVRGGAGYAWFEGTRRFLYAPNTALPTGVVREANAEWNGLTASAHASVQYEQRLGRFYARPGLSVDYFYLKEDEREEEGAGALNQIVEDRTSNRLSSTFDVAFGADFGRAFWWRPEVRVGYRQILSGEVGDTVARFAGGTPFTVSAMDPGEGAALVGLALKMGTAMSYLALEGEMEQADGEDRYNVKLTGRVMF